VITPYVNDTPPTRQADYFVKKRIEEILRIDPDIDTLVLGCTHYPLLLPAILRHVPRGITVVPQGDYVAHSLCDYLQRHPEMETRLAKNGKVEFLTTEEPKKFRESATIFMPDTDVKVEQITL